MGISDYSGTGKHNGVAGVADPVGRMGDVPFYLINSAI